MSYKLFFRDEFFKDSDFYMVKVTKEEFYARVDFVSEFFPIEKHDLSLDRVGYYANNIIFGIVNK